MRYIDADALIAYLYDYQDCDIDIPKEIAEFPTADVSENVRAEWVNREVIDDRKDAKIQQWQQAQCSICGKWHTTPYMYYFTDYDFCPNCGADMRGEK